MIYRDTSEMRLVTPIMENSMGNASRPNVSLQSGENLARLADVVEAVCQRKRKPISSSTNDYAQPIDPCNSQSPSMSISNVLRRKGRTLAEFLEKSNKVSSDLNNGNVVPSSNVPSVMAISDHQFSSGNAKRQRIAYALSDQALKLPSTIQDSDVRKQQHLDTYVSAENLQGTPDLPESKAEQPVEIVRFREYQAEIWSEKFEELCAFRRCQGHCHVPHHYDQNPGLAAWVKRQRYQYKLKLDGKRSTLSDERIRLLNKIGFIWNSHDAVWEERLQDLMSFKRIHGHCIVPSNYRGNPQLAVWTKRQRRQYKKYQEGGSSSMTTDRISKLEKIGFVWDCRNRKINKTDYIDNNVNTDLSGAGAPSISETNISQWPNTTGSNVLGNFLSQNNSGTENPGLNVSVLNQFMESKSAKSIGMRNPLSNQIGTAVYDGKDSNGIQLTKGSFLTINPYDGNHISSNANVAQLGARSITEGGVSHGNKSALSGKSTNQDNFETATTGLEDGASSGITEASGRTQSEPQIHLRCDFFSFSRNFNPKKKM